jgi:hypothetical protein
MLLQIVRISFSSQIVPILAMTNPVLKFSHGYLAVGDSVILRHASNKSAHITAAVARRNSSLLVGSVIVVFRLFGLATACGIEVLFLG